MIDYQDEVLAGEARFRIADKNGNVILDEVTIELITKILKAGTPLNKVLFDKIKSYLVPSGLISMWSGSIVPEGWFLCNGENGTPDLRNRFIVGAGAEYDIGATGGEKTHTLSTSEMPSHKHTINVNTEPGSTYDDEGNDYLSVIDSNSGSTRLAGLKYKDGEISLNTTTTGNGQAHENRPPYYALAYIMKA